MGAAVISVEVTKSGKTVTINERNEVKGEIMTCLFKKFPLTYENIIIKKNFTSQIGDSVVNMEQKIYIKRSYTINVEMLDRNRRIPGNISFTINENVHTRRNKKRGTVLNWTTELRLSGGG